MKKLISALVLFAAVTVPFSVRADAIQDGYHPVVSCYEIDNLAEFPEYTVFLLGSDPLPDTSQVGVGDCVSFYKFSTGTFTAVPTDGLDELLGEFMIHPEYGGVSFREPDGDLVGSSTWGVDNREAMIESGVLLVPYNPQQVPDSNPLERVDAVYHITELNDGGFYVTQTSVRYGYNDGTFETHSVGGPDAAYPEPTRDGTLPWLIIGVVFLAGLVTLRKVTKK